MDVKDIIQNGYVQLGVPTLFMGILGTVQSWIGITYLYVLGGFCILAAYIELTDLKTRTRAEGEALVGKFKTFK